MESGPPTPLPPPKKTLETYAISYLGAYLNTVKKERPEHVPILARGSQHMVEVCIMPNGCYSLLFEKADAQDVVVKECDWEYVEQKVISGVDNLVALYAHEGVTVADAIARGKRDAVRDIRSLEDSGISKAITALEKVLQSMTSVEQSNRTVAEVGEKELAKLRPIREAIQSAGPEVDMLRLVDALRHYPGTQTVPKVEFEAKQLLEGISRDLGDLSDLIGRVEGQDQKLEELEHALRKALTELNKNMDERIAKGLAIILAASDKKIDKGFAALAGASNKDVMFQLPRELEVRLEAIEKDVRAIQMQVNDTAIGQTPETALPKALEERLERLDSAAAALQAQVEQGLGQKGEDGVSAKLYEELVVAVAQINEDIARINNRIIKIEEFLAKSGTGAQAPRVRALRQQVP
jgi:DNA repair exonuclease SbcCD ATPase subunit